MAKPDASFFYFDTLYKAAAAHMLIAGTTATGRLSDRKLPTEAAHGEQFHPSANVCRPHKPCLPRMRRAVWCTVRLPTRLTAEQASIAGVS